MTQAAGREIGRAGWALAATLAVAALLRLVALAALPPAHYRDVAITALDALRAAAGHPRLHYVYDEGLYSNLMAVVFLLAGVSDWTVRLGGAVFGVLTCLGVFRLGRALGAPRAGLCGALLLAVSLWHVILSRSGFRAVLLPLVLVFAMAFLVEGLRGGRIGRMALAGALFGLCVHTYPASRAAPLLVPIYLLAELGFDRAAWGRALRGLVLFVAAAGLVAAPMLLHYLHQPRDFNNPDRIVSVFSPRLQPGDAGLYLMHNVGATLLMFHVRGDTNWRHNIPGAPMLDPLTGLLFLAGLGAAVVMLSGGLARHVERPRGAAGLLLAWVIVMLLPNLLSVEGVPHGLRSAGALPAIMLLSGLGAVLAGEWLMPVLGRRGVAATALVLAVGLSGLTGYRYFVTWGRDPGLAAAHDGAYRAAARALLGAPPGAGRFLVTNGTGFRVYGAPAEVQAYLFEMRAAPPDLLGPKDAARLALSGRTALVALVRRDDQVLDVIRALNPGAPVRELSGDGMSPDSPVFRIN